MHMVTPVKEPFSAFEMYMAAVRMFPAMAGLIGNAISKRVKKQTVERIMLAVTEVNGCEVCSYAHTKMALKAGMSQEEINAMLSASGEHVPEDEAVAIFFAQHYAESRGKPDRTSYERFMETYGKKEGKAMLDAIQMMMYANITGLPISGLLARFKKNPHANSSLIREIVMILMTPVVTVLAIPHALLNAITFRKRLRTQ
jgi:AhpD family alkylhydroperoxidase